MRAKWEVLILGCTVLTPSSAASAQTAPGASTATEASVPPQGAQDASQIPGNDDGVDASGIGDIIVTATRREASLQDVAVAITAVTGEALQDRGINDISNLAAYVPNLRVGQEQDGFKVSLRGIGVQGTSSITDSGIAFYQDNFYLGRPAGGSAVFYDLSRVEVLRGPQGTLYGRNATGGVVNVIANAPTRAFEGEVGASYGSRNYVEARGFLNVPLGEIAAARVTALYSRDDGYFRNTFNGERLNGSDGDITVRGQLLLGTPDTVEALLYGSYSKLNGNGVAQKFVQRNIAGPPPVQALLRTIPADDPDPLDIANDAESYNDTETAITFARLTKDFGGVQAFLQVGKLWQDTRLQQDFDGSAVDASIFNKDQDSTSESVEFRLSSTGTRRLSWIVGAYYFNEDTDIFRRVRLNGLTPAGRISLPDFLLYESGHSKTAAAFGSATLTLADPLRVTGGIRYTRDEKNGTKVNTSKFGQPLDPSLPNAQFPADVEFDKVTWKGGIEYDVARDVLIYGNVSNGYKAGGFNLSSDGQPYDPETITAYEIGLKSDLFDRRARINVDAFYYDYKDLQLTTLGGEQIGQFTTNAAASTLWGVEVDTQFKLTQGLLFSASYSYLDATFDEYLNRDPLLPAGAKYSLAGNRLPFVSKHTVNVGLSYDRRVGSGRVSAAINTNFHSDYFLREFNARAIDRVPANTRTDVTLSYGFGDSGPRITAYVTNLEDNVERNNIYLTPGFIGTNATTSYTRPRTAGVRVNYEF